jgi:hypothetical protein
MHRECRQTLQRGDDVRRARALQRLFCCGRREKSAPGNVQGITAEPHTPPFTSTLAAAHPDGGGMSGAIIATHGAGVELMSSLRRSRGFAGRRACSYPTYCLPEHPQRRPSLESTRRLTPGPAPSAPASNIRASHSSTLSSRLTAACCTKGLPSPTPLSPVSC